MAFKAKKTHKQSITCWNFLCIPVRETEVYETCFPSSTVVNLGEAVRAIESGLDEKGPQVAPCSRENVDA